MGRGIISFFFERLDDLTEGFCEIFNDLTFDGMGDGAVFFVISFLDSAPLAGDQECSLDRFGDLIGIHDNTAFDISRSPAAGLN